MSCEGQCFGNQHPGVKPHRQRARRAWDPLQTAGSISWVAAWGPPPAPFAAAQREVAALGQELALAQG